MFEKAQRKVEESRFFLECLRTTSGHRETEFFFNAILNAGKNVVNGIRAQLTVTETSRSRGRQARPNPKKSYDRHYKAWKRSIEPTQATLFDALQALRDIETHTHDSGARHLPKATTRRQPRETPTDPTCAAVVASYMARRSLPPDVTIATTTYDLSVDPATSSRTRVRALLKQFARGKLRPSADIAASYANSLESLAQYFVTHYS